MKLSTDRILTTHVGSLPRSAPVCELLIAKEKGKPYDAEQFERTMRDEVAAVVRRQVETGIDVVSDGETAKIGYSTYMQERLTGFGGHVDRKMALDLADYPELRKKLAVIMGPQEFNRASCIGPVAVKTLKPLERDLENFKAALPGSGAAEGFLNAASPGMVSAFQLNHYYKTHAEYVGAVAAALLWAVGAQAGPLRVSAAASLTDVMQAVAGMIGAKGGKQAAVAGGQAQNAQTGRNAAGQIIALRTYNFQSDIKPAYLDEYATGLEFALSHDYNVRIDASRKFDWGATGGRAINVLTPYSAYTDVRCATDPGVDGKVGTSDDNPRGPVCTYSIPSSNPNRTVTNILYRQYDYDKHEGVSSYTGFDFTFSKNYSHGWSMLAGYGISLAHPGVAAELAGELVVHAGVAAIGLGAAAQCQRSAGRHLQHHPAFRRVHSEHHGLRRAQQRPCTHRLRGAQPDGAGRRSQGRTVDTARAASAQRDPLAHRLNTLPRRTPHGRHRLRRTLQHR